MARPFLASKTPALVTGTGRFVGDLSFLDQLHMRIVRSPRAHGRILAVDTAAARALPGGSAVWTGDYTADIPPGDFRDPSAQALRPRSTARPAAGRRRYVGEPLAAVFVHDPTWPRTRPISSRSRSASAGHFCPPRTRSANSSRAVRPKPTVLRHSYGDIERAFAAAHAVVELDLDLGRHSAVPLETRGAIGGVRRRRRHAQALWRCKGPAPQSRHLMPDARTKPVGAAPARAACGRRLRGARRALSRGRPGLRTAATRLRRPVKWIEDRREHLLAANHSRQQRHLARMAVDADGRILGIDDELFHDQGAYIRTHGARVMARTLWSIPPAPMACRPTAASAISG